MNLEFLTFHAHDISSPAERLINWKVYFNTHKLCLVRLASSLVPPSCFLCLDLPPRTCARRVSPIVAPKKGSGWKLCLQLWDLSSICRWVADCFQSSMAHYFPPIPSDSESQIWTEMCYPLHQLFLASIPSTMLPLVCFSKLFDFVACLRGAIQTGLVSIPLGDLLCIMLWLVFPFLLPWWGKGFEVHLPLLVPLRKKICVGGGGAPHYGK